MHPQVRRRLDNRRKARIADIVDMHRKANADGASSEKTARIERAGHGAAGKEARGFKKHPRVESSVT
jgi:hypothetical protein